MGRATALVGGEGQNQILRLRRCSDLVGKRLESQNTNSSRRIRGNATGEAADRAVSKELWRNSLQSLLNKETVQCQI